MPRRPITQLARAAAVLATVLVATGGVLEPSTTVQSGDTAQSAEAPAPDLGVDPDTLGSITLHSIPDATFEVRRDTGIDLTTEEGWAALEALDGPGSAEPAGTPHATDSAGIAVIADLPVGAYWIEQTDTPDGYLPSEPILATIPVADPEGEVQWVYDNHVHVASAPAPLEPEEPVESDMPDMPDEFDEPGEPALPDHPDGAASGDTPQSAEGQPGSAVGQRQITSREPKASPITVTKTVNDDDVIASGHPLSWTIEANVPAGRVWSYLMRDVFNGHLWWADGTSAETAVYVQILRNGTWVDAVRGPRTGEDEDKDDPKGDYWLGYDMAYPGIDDKWGMVEIGFKPNKDNVMLEDVTAVRMTVTARFNTLMWPLVNVAEGWMTPAEWAGRDLTDILLDRGWVEADIQGLGVVRGQADVQSKWGTITVKKTEADGVTPIQGAEFMVFDSLPKARALVRAQTQEDWAAAREQAIVFDRCGNGAVDCREYEYATNPAGIATFRALRYSAWANNGVITSTDPRYREYYVVESRAAPGYGLSPRIEKVVLGSSPTLHFTDPSLKAGYRLPLAGGSGDIMLFVAAGLGVAVIAAGVLAREIRR